MHPGSEEALVVPFERKGQFHGPDGFNGLGFDSEPDISRLSSEPAASAIARIASHNQGMRQQIFILPLCTVWPKQVVSRNSIPQMRSGAYYYM